MLVCGGARGKNVKWPMHETTSIDNQIRLTTVNRNTRTHASMLQAMNSGARLAARVTMNSCLSLEHLHNDVKAYFNFGAQ